MDGRKQQHYFPFYKIFNGLSDSTSFQRRLLLSFLFIAIPVISGVLVIAFFIIQFSTHETVTQTQATELEKTSAQLEFIFSDTENMSRELIYNSAVQEYLAAANESAAYPDDTDASYFINGLILNREYINSIVLTTKDRTIYSTENAYSDRAGFQNIREKWWYPQLTELDTPYAWFPYSTLTATVYESQENNEIPPQINTLMLIRPVISTADYHTVLGYLMIYLDDEYMVELWQDITWGKTANVFLVSDTGELLMKNSMMNDYSEVFSQADPKQGNYIFRYEKEPYVLTSSEMETDPWMLYMLTPYQEVNDTARTMIYVLFLAIAAIILALFFMSKYSSGNMARPIVILSKMMDAYHGADQKFDENMVRLYQNRSDEIGQMYRSYEQLEERMNRLIQEIYVKNLEKKDAELALLQSQIDPHFLYNTLDSINWIALANDQDEISEMITALSDTFRLSLMKNNSSFVEMEQEIQYIQSYLILQKFRYADRLAYDFDMPDPLPPLYIPRFILQPVVENALKHGINTLENGGRLLIQVSVGKQVVLRVVNDGTNIDLEKMKSLLIFHPEDSDILNFKKEGYGVQNIHRRIKIICGDEYGLSYSTTKTQTICQILLPVRESL